MFLSVILGRGHNAVILVILVILRSGTLGIIVALTHRHYRSAPLGIIVAPPRAILLTTYACPHQGPHQGSVLDIRASIC